jgi:hypothetical protein
MLNTHFPLAFNKFDDKMLKMAVESWYYGLHDLDTGLVFNVTLKIIATEEKDFPPKMATIRKECLKAMNPTTILSPEIAFELARKTVVKYGRYNKEKGLNSIDNPSVKRALLGVGWDRIGNASDDTIGYVKNDFIKLYEDVDSSNREQYLVPQGTLSKIQEYAKQQQLETKNEMS